jgi:predicted acylesterase/phospholipase RssA
MTFERIDLSDLSLEASLYTELGRNDVLARAPLPCSEVAARGSTRSSVQISEAGRLALAMDVGDHVTQKSRSLQNCDQQPVAVAYDIRPQGIPRYDAENRLQGFTVIRQAPPLESLVFQGGGAKGFVNANALVEMQHAGMLDGLKHVVGSSVGALTAIAMAGMDAEAFQDFTDEIEMKKLRYTSDGFRARYPMIDTDWRLGFRAGHVLELMDRKMAQQVSSYLNAHWDSTVFQGKLERLRTTEGEGGPERLAQLRRQDFNTDRTSQMVTFNDLRLMRLVDPAQFKTLTLTGWDETRREEIYFDAQKTPDVPIAVAGRISMSFPIYFKNVDYDPGDGHGRRTFVDGGVGSNMPAEVITKDLRDRELEQARMRTAVLTFDAGGDAYEILHRPSMPPSSFSLDGVMGKIAGIVAGNPDYNQTSYQDRLKTHEAGPNAFVVFHGDLGTLDLGASRGRINRAQIQAALKMREQIDLRQGQAYAQEYSSAEECFVQLNEREKRAILDGPLPDPGVYPQGREDLGYRFELGLFELARHEASSRAS